MKIKISFLENEIALGNDFVRCLEIENKKYFYRFIQALNEVSKGVLSEEEVHFDEDGYQFKIIVDYFNFDFYSKKITMELNQKIKQQLDEVNYDDFLKVYKKLCHMIGSLLQDIDLPIDLQTEMKIEEVIKMMDLKIRKDSELLSNLFTLIELSKMVNDKTILVFINLKQYLTNQELRELYKYAFYHKRILLLVDSQSYGITRKYEEKLIIDDNLDEFVI